jgi:hypothetical protein
LDFPDPAKTNVAKNPIGARMGIDVDRHQYLDNFTAGRRFNPPGAIALT